MLENQTAVITGASSGIGRALASAFLRKGANIVINSRSKDRLESFFDEHPDHAARICMVPGDVGNKSTGKALAETAIREFRNIDVLVNNAGIFVPKPFLEATEKDLDMYLSTAVKGTFFTTQAVIPSMIRNNNGAIINIGSMWVEHPLATTPCSASQVAKGGVHTLTRHLAIEFAANNIRVNTIAPAVISTSLYDNLMPPNELEKLAALHPLNRLGTTDDITAWVLHLASDGGRFVTGQTFFVDGGITVGSHF